MDQRKQTRTVRVDNRAGLHARAALLIAKLAREHDVALAVVKDSQAAEASSMIQMLSLGAKQGDDLVLEASGPRAEEALTALERLFAEKFYEEDEDAESRG
jgi:phosphotransferase system HPr (HPr) family protein